MCCRTQGAILLRARFRSCGARDWLKARGGTMAQSAAAAAAAKRSIETARRSGPDLDVSFVLAFMFLSEVSPFITATFFSLRNFFPVCSDKVKNLLTFCRCYRSRQ